MTESAQVTHGIDLSPCQPLQSIQTASLGVVGRRSGTDLGAISDNISGLPLTFGASHHQQSTMQLLTSSFHQLPQPKDLALVELCSQWFLYVVK